MAQSISPSDIMNYYLNAPPLHPLKDFAPVPKKELKAFFTWFLENMEPRLLILEEAVRSSPGYENWISTYTDDSLKELGNWFKEHISIKKLTPAETEFMRESAGIFADYISDWRLTAETYSLIMDVAYYWAKILMKKYPHLKWIQKLTGKTLDTYGAPQLSNGFNTLYPVTIIETMAYKMIENNEDGIIIYNINKYWSNSLSVNKWNSTK